MWALLLLVCQLAAGLIIQFPSSSHQVLDKLLLLPVQVPWVPQDPQGVPRNPNRAFGFIEGGILNVNLQLTDRLISNDGKIPRKRETGPVLPRRSLLAYLTETPALVALLAPFWPSRFTARHNLAAALAAVSELPPTNKLDATFELPRKDEPIAYFLVLNSEQWEVWIETLVQQTSFPRDEGIVLSAARDTYTRAVLRVPVYRDTPVQLSWVAPQEDMYTILILNPERRILQLEGELSLVNPGNLEHLSTTMRYQSLVLLASHLLNCGSAIVLSLYQLIVMRLRKTELHGILTLCFLMKATYLLLDLFNLKALQARGTLRPLEWVVPRIFANIQGIILLALFLLLAFGWKVHRSYLTLLETRLLTCVCLLSTYLGVFEVSMGVFQAIRYVIHSLVYLIVLVAVNFDIVLLGSMLSDMGVIAAETDNQTESTIIPTAAMYQKREAYMAFRSDFILFVLKPTIDLFYKLIVLPGVETEDWTVVAVDNLIDWYILTSIAYRFRSSVYFPLLKDLQSSS